MATRYGEVTVITATLDHIEDLIPLFDGYRQFYKQPSDLERARRFLEDRFTLRESVIFLAYVDDRPVGFTQLYPTFSSVSTQRMWILNDLFVAPDTRGLRVGEALIQKAAEYSAFMGAKGLALETARDNLSAQKLYERVGFARDTEFYSYYLATPKASDE